MIYRFDSLDSTNKKLIELMDSEYVPGGKFPELAVTALKQTGGRGRLGRSFESPPGGLYISFSVPLDDAFKITARSAVLVKRAIHDVSGIDCKIKWVNDLYYNSKKVCGILAQAQRNYAVVGIGINWSTDVCLLPEVAGSLNQDYSLLGNLAERLEYHIYHDSSPWLEEYKTSDLLIGKTVDVFKAGEKVFCGKVSGIDDSCSLLLEVDGKQVVLSSGEVSVRLK